MRATYILAVIIAATFHASGTALPATKDSKDTIENAASPVIVDVTQADGGRQLRGMDKYANKEDEVEEERFFSKFGKWLQKQGTNWKASRREEKVAKENARRQRMRENIIESGGVLKI